MSNNYGIDRGDKPTLQEVLDAIDTAKNQQSPPYGPMEGGIIDSTTGREIHSSIDNDRAFMQQAEEYFYSRIRAVIPTGVAIMHSSQFRSWVHGSNPISNILPMAIAALDYETVIELLNQFLGIEGNRKAIGAVGGYRPASKFTTTPVETKPKEILFWRKGE